MHANDVAVSQPVAKSGAANFQNAAKAEPAITGDPTLWHQRHIGINAEPLVRVHGIRGRRLQNSAPRGALPAIAP